MKKQFLRSKLKIKLGKTGVVKPNQKTGFIWLVNESPLAKVFNFTGSIIGTIDGIKNFISWGITALTGYSVVSAGAQKPSRNSVNIIDAIAAQDFLVSVIAFMCLTIFFGWGLGSLLKYVTRQCQEHWHVIAWCIAGLWGLIVSFTASALTKGAANSTAEQLSLTVIGLCIMLSLVTFQLRASVAGGDPLVMSRRANAMLVFTLATICTTALIVMLNGG